MAATMVAQEPEESTLCDMEHEVHVHGLPPKQMRRCMPRHHCYIWRSRVTDVVAGRPSATMESRRAMARPPYLARPSNSDCWMAILRASSSSSSAAGAPPPA
jgi:hypothetical protein